jgi:hypothetical protein
MVIRSCSRRVAAALAAGAVVVGLWACSGETAGDELVREPPPPFRHAELYADLHGEAEELTFEGGDWREDWGDAAFYGLAFYGRASVQANDSSWRDRADRAAARSLAVIDDADLLAGDINEISMSALGLVDYIAATGETSMEPALAELIDRIDALVPAIGWYLDTDAVDSFAIDTYGPTSVSALIGLLNLQYAHTLGGARAADFVAWAREMQSHIDERAWTGTHYAFGRGRDGMFLYPNVSMIVHSARLYQLTGEEAYRERALAVYDAIQAIRIDESDGSVRYRSPYSADVMGAQTDDYTTLSSQNYTMFALQSLYEITGRAAFIDETDRIVDALATLLWGPWCLSEWHKEPCAPACVAEQACVVEQCRADACHEGVLHHWMDGAPADPSHPELFCSGCNLQLLYILWRRQFLL